MEGKTIFSRSLKQFDGLTSLTFILRQIYATGGWSRCGANYTLIQKKIATRTWPILFLQYLLLVLTDLTVFSPLKLEIISAHSWNKNPSPYLNCVSALPDKCCETNICISYALWVCDNKVRSVWASHSHRTSQIRSPL